MWGDMGLFSRAFLDQNLFISSLAVVPIGAALQGKKRKKKKLNVMGSVFPVRRCTCSLFLFSLDSAHQVSQPACHSKGVPDASPPGLHWTEAAMSVAAGGVSNRERVYKDLSLSWAWVAAVLPLNTFTQLSNRSSPRVFNSVIWGKFKANSCRLSPLFEGACLCQIYKWRRCLGQRINFFLCA